MNNESRNKNPHPFKIIGLKQLCEIIGNWM